MFHNLVSFFRGYFPKGGGEVKVTCSPIKRLQPIDLTEFGVVTNIYGRAFVAGVIPVKVGASISTFYHFCLRTMYCLLVLINY